MRSAAWRSGGGGERRCLRPPGAAAAAGPSRAPTAPWTPRRARRAAAGGTRYRGRAPGTAWPRPHAGGESGLASRPPAAPVARAGRGERGVAAGRPRAWRPRARAGRAAASPRVGAAPPDAAREALCPAHGAGESPGKEGPLVSWSVTCLLSGGGRQGSVALCQPPPPSVTRTCTSSFNCSAPSSLFRVAWIHERVFSFALCLARRRKRRRNLNAGTSFRGARLTQMKARNRMTSVMPRKPRNQRVSVNRTVTRKRKAWRSRDCPPLAANPPAEADTVVPVKRQVRARVRASRTR